MRSECAGPTEQVSAHRALLFMGDDEVDELDQLEIDICGQGLPVERARCDGRNMKRQAEVPREPVHGDHLVSDETVITMGSLRGGWDE